MVDMTRDNRHIARPATKKVGNKPGTKVVLTDAFRDLVGVWGHTLEAAQAAPVVVQSAYSRVPETTAVAPSGGPAGFSQQLVLSSQALATPPSRRHHQQQQQQVMQAFNSLVSSAQQTQNMLGDIASSMRTRDVSVLPPCCVPLNC